MLITVPSAGPATVDTLLSGPDLERVYNAVKDGYSNGGATYSVLVQNLGAQNIFFAVLGEAATTTAGNRISASGGQNAVTVKRLSDLSLISTGAPNVDVRISVFLNPFG